MSRYIPFIFEDEITGEYGIKKSAFETFKSDGISKAIFCFYAETFIDDNLRLEIENEIEETVNYSFEYGIIPKIAFMVSVFPDDRCPKMIVPKTQRAYTDIIKTIRNTKTDDMYLEHIYKQLRDNREEYLVGEGMEDYEYCPVIYRPFPFRDRKFVGNTNASEFEFDTSRESEQCIKQYDFFYSRMYSDYKKYTSVSLKDYFYFYVRCAITLTPFVICPKYLDNWFLSKHKIKAVCRNEVINYFRKYDKRFANYTLFASSIDLYKNILYLDYISKH